MLRKIIQESILALFYIMWCYLTELHTIIRGVIKMQLRFTSQANLSTCLILLNYLQAFTTTCVQEGFSSLASQRHEVLFCLCFYSSRLVQPLPIPKKKSLVSLSLSALSSLAVMSSYQTLEKMWIRKKKGKPTLINTNEVLQKAGVVV